MKLILDLAKSFQNIREVLQQHPFHELKHQTQISLVVITLVGQRGQLLHLSNEVTTGQQKRVISAFLLALVLLELVPVDHV